MTAPIKMGFLSSLVNISFPSIYGLVWVNEGVSKLQPNTMQLDGQPILAASATRTFIAIRGITPQGPLGSPKTPNAYGGRGVIAAGNSTLAQNFFAFRIPSKDTIVITCVPGGNGAQFIGLAGCVVNALALSSLAMTFTNSVSSKLLFKGRAGADGMFQNQPPAFGLSAFGPDIIDFAQNNGASATIPNEFTFTQEHVVVTPF